MVYKIGTVSIPSIGAWKHPVSGMKYPANWIQLSSLAERQSLGVVETPDPIPPEPTLEELQEEKIAGVKMQATMILRETDWEMIKALERQFKAELDVEGQDLATSREAVRTASDNAEVDIFLAKTVAELKALPVVDLRATALDIEAESAK